MQEMHKLRPNQLTTKHQPTHQARTLEILRLEILRLKLELLKICMLTVLEILLHSRLDPEVAQVQLLIQEVQVLQEQVRQQQTLKELEAQHT